MNQPRWLAYHGLSRPPFSKEIDDQDLWLPSSKEEIVAELCEAAAERNSAILVGEPGMGKTCLLRALRHRLPEAGFRLTYCHNATLGRRDFYRQLCQSVGLSPKATAASVFYAVSTHIEQLGSERVHPVFLLDEAHLLHQDVLDHLHILLNYQWDSRSLLSLVLVGLPQLWDRLQLRHNRSLYSRIFHRLSVGPALPQDTAEYVEYRLESAEAEGNPFTSDAIGMLHEAAGGSLRDIDRIATMSLKNASRRNLRRIDSAVIEHVLKLEDERRSQ